MPVAAPTRTETLNSVTASSLPYFDKKVYDGVFRGHNVFKLVIEKKGMKVVGGTTIRFPFQYQNDLNTKVMSSDMDLVDLETTDSVLQAVESWSYYTQGLAIPNTQIDDNMGKAQIFDLMNQKVKIAGDALRETMEDHLLATSQTAGRINSLITLAPTDPTTGTLHGVNRATYTAFRSITNTTGGAITTVMLNFVRNMYYQCSRAQNVDQPDVALMSLNTFDLWSRFVDPRHFITTSGETNVPKPMRLFGMDFIWNTNYPNNTSILVLNTNFMKVYISSDSRNNGKWQEPTDQIAQTRKIHLRCNVVVTEPARLGNISSLTAS